MWKKLNLIIKDTFGAFKEVKLCLLVDDKVVLQGTFEGELLSFEDEHCFGLLSQFRSYLEERGYLLCCHGSLRQVYPSSMTLSMGEGRLAYCLSLVQPVRVTDLVDIFEDNGLSDDYVSLAEQVAFYHKWLESLEIC